VYGLGDDLQSMERQLDDTRDLLRAWLYWFDEERARERPKVQWERAPAGMTRRALAGMSIRRGG